MDEERDLFQSYNYVEPDGTDCAKKALHTTRIGGYVGEPDV